jgi:hypothetical protein
MSIQRAVAGKPPRPRAKTTPGTDHPVPMPPAPQEVTALMAASIENARDRQTRRIPAAGELVRLVRTF